MEKGSVFLLKKITWMSIVMVWGVGGWVREIHWPTSERIALELRRDIKVQIKINELVDWLSVTFKLLFSFSSILSCLDRTGPYTMGGNWTERDILFPKLKRNGDYISEKQVLWKLFLFIFHELTGEMLCVSANEWSAEKISTFFLGYKSRD